jgi:hypothetical protein
MVIGDQECKMYAGDRWLKAGSWKLETLEGLKASINEDETIFSVVPNHFGGLHE